MELIDKALIVAAPTTALLLYAGVGFIDPLVLIFGLAAVIAFVVYRNNEAILENLQDRVGGETGVFTDSSEAFQDFDEMWEEVQDWYSRPPRNGELKWKPGVSQFDTTVPSSVDGEYRFVAVKTPSAGTDQNVFFCVEMNTRSLLTWNEKAEINRKDLFNYVELVKDIRRRNVSTEQVQQRLRNGRVARLGGANGSNQPIINVSPGDSKLLEEYENQGGSNEKEGEEK